MELEESLRHLLEQLTQLLPLQLTADKRIAYSEHEAAAMLGVEIHVLREQRKLGRITHCKGPGRRILYRPADLLQYLDDNEVSAKNDPS